MSTSSVMAKKPLDESTVTVKIRASIHRQAKQVALHRSIDLSVYLSDLLEKLVQRDYKKTIAEIAKEVEDDSTPGTES